MSRYVGPFWLLMAVIAAAVFFQEGLNALLAAWQLPEYSHGPLIPVLSGLLFLRQLKTEPVHLGAQNDRWPGLLLLGVALAFGALGKLAQIDDITAYATILWVGAVLLISFGWQQGKHFWPPVLHLVYMLPLPGVLYYKLSTFLQAVSSELGVWFLHVLGVTVFLEGNIIDLGVYKLHVAEACSGLRYLFPILSFSYIFAVLYKGPMWHKAVLLISAAPITVFMNSVRIALAGVIVERWGPEHVEGFSHFFEGWVIFMACVVILFLLAWLMLFIHPDKPSLPDALDLDTDGLVTQMARLRLVQPSRALILGTLMVTAAAAVWYMRPAVETVQPSREPFALFPRQMGEWKAGPPKPPLSAAVEQVLGADDYHSIDFFSSKEAAKVEFFSAFYKDQTKGGTHSPEICLPSAGWEIAWLERVDIAPEVGFDAPYMINRAVIQKSTNRMLAYYWFEQHGRHVAWDFAAKFYLLYDGITMGRTDGALVRLITPIARGETEEEAEARLQKMFKETVQVLPRFVPN
ncbi:VPLPA-CTERM-specific exosortase XrtD [Litorivita sp. NS0012-18]|uniref:VPLPA-CTERM-specific exosortase XrtD n=1 Tax=Litorivita sp. NS0012-18 TaxID=3127655 RepID=UPI003342B26A